MRKALNFVAMEHEPEWNLQRLLGSPLFAPLHAWLARLDETEFPGLEELNRLLAECEPAITVSSGRPLQFVEQLHGKLPFEAQYEPRCYLEGALQTRSGNWHDLFNALVWLAFPQAKREINARHYHALNGKTAGKGRGSGRDMLTLLDESGVLVACADEELAGLLRTFCWKDLFWRQRERVKAAMDFHLFGHGLYEKAMYPYVGMTGQGLVMMVEPRYFSMDLPARLAYMDKLLAVYLEKAENCLDTRELAPVPLLGIPGWTVDNENPAYYDNTRYFRSGRKNGKTV